MGFPMFEWDTKNAWKKSTRFEALLNIRKSSTICALVLQFLPESFLYEPLPQSSSSASSLCHKIPLEGWTITLPVNSKFCPIQESQFESLNQNLQNSLQNAINNNFDIFEVFFDIKNSSFATDALSFVYVGPGEPNKIPRDDIALYLQAFFQNNVSNVSLLMPNETKVTKYTICFVPLPDGKENAFCLPDALKYVGDIGVSVFFDPQHFETSSLNILITTKDGHGLPISSLSSGIPTSNWFSPQTKILGKVLFGHRTAWDTFLLKPVYYTIARETWRKLTQNGEFNPITGSTAPFIPLFEDARNVISPSKTQFFIANSPTGQDRYQNVFEVQIINKGPITEALFLGKIWAGKFISHLTNFNSQTSEAFGQGITEWKGLVSIDHLSSKMKISFSFTPTSIKRETSSNKDVTDVDLNTIEEFMKNITPDFGREILDTVSNVLNKNDISGVGQVSINDAFHFFEKNLKNPCILPDGQTLGYGNTVFESESTNVNMIPSITQASKTQTLEDNPAVPVIDQLILKGSGDYGGTNLFCTVSSELMKNMQHVLPIQASSYIVAVEDSLGNPLIFSIGSDAHLYLLRRTPDYSGWISIDLLVASNFNTGGLNFVQVIDVFQDLQGLLSIAFAIGNGQEGAPLSRLYLTPTISNNLTNLDSWLQDFARFTRELVDPAIPANRTIYTSLKVSSPNTNAYPIVLGVLKIDGITRLYFNIFPTPFSTGKELLAEYRVFEDIAIGALSLDSTRVGVFTLFTESGRQSLWFIVWDDQSRVFDLSPRSAFVPDPLKDKYVNIRCITSFRPLPNLFTDLLVGTASNGVFIIRQGALSTLQQIPFSDEIKDITKIFVTFNGNDISVWVLSSPSYLNYIKGTITGESYSWAIPIQFSRTSVNLAPLKSKVRSSNEVFVINNDYSITNFMQDSKQKLWNSRVSKINGNDLLMEVNTFTLIVHFEDSSFVPIFDRIVRITGTQMQYITTNGKVSIVDVDVPTVVPLDTNGNITLILSTQTIDSPIIHIVSDDFTGVINIYPNNRIIKGMGEQATSVERLQAAKTQYPENEKVVTSGISNETLSGAASGVQSLHDVVNPQTAYQENVGVFSRVSALPDLGNLDMTAIATDFSFGMVLKEGEWIEADENEKRLLRDMSDEFRATRATLDSTTGDVLHFMENSVDGVAQDFKDGKLHFENNVSFELFTQTTASNKILRFILRVAQKIHDVIVRVRSEVCRVIGFIIKCIGAEIEKVIKWLGRVFSWKTIWETHKLITAMVNNGLTYLTQWLSHNNEQAITTLSNLFTTIPEQIENLVVPDKVKSSVPGQDAKNPPLNSGNGNVNNPGSNYASYHLQHGNFLDGGDVSPLNISAKVLDMLDNFYNEVLAPFIAAVENDINNVFNAIKQFLNPATNKVQDVYNIAHSFINLFFDPMKTLIIGIANFAQQLLPVVLEMINQPINFPIITSFWNLISRLSGDSQPEPLTVLNFTSLLVSIFISPLFVAVTGVSIKEYSTLPLDDLNLFATLLGPPTQFGPDLISPNNQEVSSNIMEYMIVAGFINTDCNLLSSLFDFWIDAYPGNANALDILSIICLVARLVLVPADTTGLGSGSEHHAEYRTSYAFKWLGFAASLFYSCYRCASHIKRAVGNAWSRLDSPISFMVSGVASTVFSLCADIPILAVNTNAESGLAFVADVCGGVGVMVQASSGWKRQMRNPPPPYSELRNIELGGLAFQAVSLGASIASLTITKDKNDNSTLADDDAPIVSVSKGGGGGGL